MSDITEEFKNDINGMSYEELLRKCRYAPIGDPMFQGERGEYVLRRMRELRSLPGGNEIHVRASKKIGWD